MTLQNMIDKRKSFRKYTAQPVAQELLDQIRAFVAEAKPLYPDIRVRMEYISRENVKCIQSWIPLQFIAIYSEEKDGYLENAGFIFQQVDLFLQAAGLGSCWLGLGKPEEKVKNQQSDGLKFVILLAFGYTSDSLREGAAEFKRKPLVELSDREDARLECVRLAPSSVNSQPWYFTHEGDLLHTYCSKQGLLKTKVLGDLNRIDMGIALAHLYVNNPGAFEFFRAEQEPKIKNHTYIGSIKL